MPSLVIEVEQNLDTASPADKGELDDAIETIKDPDPYLSEEPFEISFSFSVDKAEVSNELEVSKKNHAFAKKLQKLEGFKDDINEQEKAELE